jgi:deoxyribodipyrimidine photo-lyase
MQTALWWIRRDLRLADNQALDQAQQHADSIVPVFVLDPALLTSGYVGDKRTAGLFDGLRALDDDLRTRGSRLVVRRGDPAKALSALRDETGAGAVYAEADVSPYARRRDARVADTLPLHLTGGLTVHPLDSVHKRDGDPYVVYTPYSRTWKGLALPDAGDLIPAPEALTTPADLPSEAIPEEPRLPDEVPFKAGERQAQERLARFARDAIYRYDDRRDRVDLNATSGLSSYLRFGMLSLRSAVVAAREAQQRARSDHQGDDKEVPQGDAEGARTWLDELIWREFYLAILYHFPEVRERSFREAYRDLDWHNDREALAAWKAGKTGFPVVDAGMRQLKAIGWMHNRARMIVASFLTKDLLIDWREGERHFMQHLIDGDPAANNGGWQWSAGTGTDAAPYFRIFNPISQGEDHDPQGVYIRRWVPELAEVPDAHIHRPWTMPEKVQQQAGCVIGADYPAPIVDHQQARRRALAAYKAARETA